MKVVEAIWEKRNLGCTAFEVSLSKGDLSNIHQCLSVLSDDRFRNALVTLKLPVGNMAAIHGLEDAGFRFVETQFQVGYDLTHYHCPPSVVEFVSPVVQVEVPKRVNDWERIAELVTPDLFETDRIALDPCFGINIGCVRYKNWMMDLVSAEDSHLYVFYKPDNQSSPLGFTLVKEQGVVSHAILGGVFTHCKIPGIGVSIWNQYLKNSAARGFARIETAVSSNNPAVLIMDSVLGYVIEKMTYVLRRPAI